MKVPRLFVAVNFEEKVKLKLIEAQSYLKKYAACGNFTQPENLHLTLVFLGEIKAGKLPEIKSAIDKINVNPFKICISSLGCFKKDDGDVYWIGVKPCFNLNKLHNDILINLKEIGFDFLTGKFSPHITLVRQTSLAKDLNKDFNHNFGSFYSEVKGINLMESTKVLEKLVYTKIHSNDF